MNTKLSTTALELRLTATYNDAVIALNAAEAAKADLAECKDDLSLATEIAAIPPTPTFWSDVGLVGAGAGIGLAVGLTIGLIFGLRR